MPRLRIFAGLLAAACCTLACTRGGERPALADLPDFTMTAVGPSGERPFGLKDMKGKVWIVDFVFTHCTGPCPLLSTRMSDLSKNLPDGVGLLTISVDPEGDTPERLRNYAGAYGADQRWVFLRGTAAQTYDLVFAGFRLGMSSDPAAPAGARVMHSTRFVLVDRAGGVRGFYDGLSDLDNAAIARDARRLLEVGS